MMGPKTEGVCLFALIEAVRSQIGQELGENDMNFVGRLLKANLATEEIELPDLPETRTRRFLSGRRINSWLVAQHADRGTDPLGPDNTPAASCGLLTGTEVLPPPACTSAPAGG